VVLTGTERWNGHGDVAVRGRKERKAAVWYARSRSRKACAGSALGPDQVRRIKTSNVFEEVISLKGARSRFLIFGSRSLVAGNVTGGGGKATTTKT